jgi:hypothetical protein
MSNKDREKLKFAFRIMAIILVIAMILGIVFGGSIFV